MSPAVGLGGWLIAAAGLGAAAALRLQLTRHRERVARACHELRGPLTTVRLGLELGVRNAHPPPSRLRAVELELGRATLALDDLSELQVAWGSWRPTARSRHRASPHNEQVDMAALVHDCVEAWRASAPVHGARLHIHGRGLGFVVTGTRLRLAQAVGNLIANAVEHGGGVVTVRLRADRGLIRIEVLDAGPGLPAPVGELAARHRRGAARGHGLAIVSGIAAAHGGSLATAPSERGARLVLELPAAASKREAAADTRGFSPTNLG